MASVAIGSNGIDLNMPTLRLKVANILSISRSISIIVGVCSRIFVK
jgi:hypothetical protein